MNISISEYIEKVITSESIDSFKIDSKTVAPDIASVEIAYRLRKIDESLERIANALEKR